MDSRPNAGASGAGHLPGMPLRSTGRRLDANVVQILDIHLFVVGGFLSSTTPRGHHAQLGERIDMTYAAMDAGCLIESELKSKMGGVVVSCRFDQKP